MTLGLILGLAVLALFSTLAFYIWRVSAGAAGLMFLLTTGASMFEGLYWYDVNTNNLGLSIGVMLIAYSICCFGLAFTAFFGQRSD